VIATGTPEQIARGRGPSYTGTVPGLDGCRSARVRGSTKRSARAGRRRGPDPARCERAPRPLGGSRLAAVLVVGPRALARLRHGAGIGVSARRPAACKRQAPRFLRAHRDARLSTTASIFPRRSRACAVSPPPTVATSSSFLSGAAAAGPRRRSPTRRRVVFLLTSGGAWPLTRGGASGALRGVRGPRRRTRRVPFGYRQRFHISTTGPGFHRPDRSRSSVTTPGAGATPAPRSSRIGAPPPTRRTGRRAFPIHEEFYVFKHDPRGARRHVFVRLDTGPGGHRPTARVVPSVGPGARVSTTSSATFPETWAGTAASSRLVRRRDCVGTAPASRRGGGC